MADAAHGLAAGLRGLAPASASEPTTSASAASAPASEHSTTATTGPGLAAGIRSLAPLPAPEHTASAPAGRPLKQIFDEVESTKQEAETALKTLDKLDLGRRQLEANRAEAGKGRLQIDAFRKRMAGLSSEIQTMEAPPPGDELYSTFHKRKATATKTITDLSKKLDKVDRHLMKAVPTLPATEASAPAATAAAAPAEAPNNKGIGGLLSWSPFGKKKSASRESLAPAAPPAAAAEKPAEEKSHEPRKVTKGEPTQSDDDDDDDEDESEGSSEEDGDDDDGVSATKPEPKPPVASALKPAPPSARSDDDDDESDSEDNDVVVGGNDTADYHGLESALQQETTKSDSNKDANSDGRQSRSSVTSRSNLKAPAVKVERSSTPPSKPKKSVATPPMARSVARKKTPSPRGRAKQPSRKKVVEEESEDDSYFEDEADEDDEDAELRRLRESGERDEAGSDHDDDDQEEDEPTVVNNRIQELRKGKYAPGTQFYITHDLKGVQTGDLTIRRGEIVVLVEQRPDDWWLFKNLETQQQGVVPINHIQLLSSQAIRRRAKPNTSATVLVDAFKAANNIPSGYIPSELAPLTQMEEYQLWRAMVPKMTESNLAFADLSWRPEVDKIHVHEVTWQKILTLKSCVKIPRIKGEQVRVLDRCVRVCLYDGFEIVSNIHTIRARVPKRVDERSPTEDWQFLPNDVNTLIDEQPQLLIRSTPTNTNQKLHLLLELSQWCQSTVTQEKCEVGSGWCMVPVHDNKPPLLTDTKGYNEVLRGGHVDETNVLLDDQYKTLRVDGLSGKIDRRKRARLQFSIESRESDDDILYDNLPTESVIVPLNLVKSLAYFRNELACQLHKRRHPTGLSTTPIDSIFLSTFFQAMEQPDLIYALRRVYRSRQRRFLASSASAQQQREEFIRTYELFIYPLLHYRQLPPYDFHDLTALGERRKLIAETIRRQLPTKQNKNPDILSLLLDPAMTDKWTPFTTDEVSFTLQKYIHNVKPDFVA